MNKTLAHQESSLQITSYTTLNPCDNSRRRDFPTYGTSTFMCIPRYKVTAMFTEWTDMHYDALGQEGPGTRLSSTELQNHSRVELQH